MTVKVVKYNTNWVDDFNTESKELARQIGGVIVRIHHIGSTAVPGLLAKPIIDILLEVISLKELDAQGHRLEAIGYEVMGPFGIKGRRYFRKGGNIRTHHIHAFVTGDPNLRRHLAFRDYLLEHQSIADEYGQLKFEIAEKCNNDVEKYCQEKDAYVKKIETIALKWYDHKHAGQ